MKVSAVVPVYNVERYLPRCLDSMLAQTLPDMEFICVDDGSTDQSGTILEEYAKRDDRIKVIHQPNGGYGVAMNTGLAAATGEYFAVLESDDFVQPDMYETLYAAAKRYDAEIVRSDYYDFSTPNGEDRLEEKQIAPDRDWYDRPICPNEEQKVYTFPMHNWTGIYKREFLEKNDIRYHETPGASYQDNGFFFRCFSLAQTLVYLPRPFYAYRIDNPGSSINNPKKVYAMTDEYAYIRENLEKDGLWDALKSVYYNRLFRAMNETYRRISPEYHKEYAAFFRKTMAQAATDGLEETLFSERELLLYKTLLRSEKQYGILSENGSSPVKACVWIFCNLRCFGLSKTVNKAKGKMKR